MLPAFRHNAKLGITVSPHLFLFCVFSKLFLYGLCVRACACFLSYCLVLLCCVS